MNIDDSILSKLTDEQKKKVEAAKSPEELLALAKEFGQDLTPEQLESISGGGPCWFLCRQACPKHSPFPQGQENE